MIDWINITCRTHIMAIYKNISRKTNPQNTTITPHTLKKTRLH